MIEHKLYMNNQLSVVTCMLRSESNFFFFFICSYALKIYTRTIQNNKMVSISYLWAITLTPRSTTFWRPFWSGTTSQTWLLRPHYTVHRSKRVKWCCYIVLTGFWHVHETTDVFNLHKRLFMYHIVWSNMHNSFSMYLVKFS